MKKMSLKKMDEMLNRLEEIEQLKKQLADEAEEIKQSLNEQFDVRETYEIKTSGWLLNLKVVERTGFDSKRFAKDYPEMYGEYKTSTPYTKLVRKSIA